MKARVSDDVYYYPDVVVGCGGEGDDPYVEHEPCLAVEVTSPSTEATDRREKVAAYRRVPTLKSYLIVDQERRHVERHYRESDDRWWRSKTTGEGALTVPCPELELTLNEIYEDVEIP